MEPIKVDSGFPERLKLVVKSYGSISSLAAAIGRSEGAVRHWLAGKTEPTVSNVLAICRITGTTVDWLITGQGPRGAQQSLELRETPGEYSVDAPGLPVTVDEALLRTISQIVAETVVRLALKKPD